jgi:hypothetical protein
VFALSAVPVALADDDEWTSFPADPTVVEASSKAGAVVDYALPSLEAKKKSAVVTCLPPPGTLLPLGKTEVVCTAVSVGSGVEVRDFKVVVRDTTPPAISGVPGAISANATGQATSVDYALPTASDLVSGSVPVSCKPAPGTAFPVGSTTVTCRAEDEAGNRASASFEVVLAADKTPPTIQKVTDVSVEAQGRTTRVEYTPPPATDNVDGAVQTACTPAPGSSFNLGRTTVTCKAVDSAGNTSSAKFDVVVTDTTAPELTVPGPVRVSASSADGVPRSHDAIAAFLAGATATDLVDGSVPATSESPSILPVGVTMVVFTAVDGAGNRARKAAAVTVELVERAVAPAAVAPNAAMPPPATPGGAAPGPPPEPTVPAAPARPPRQVEEVPRAAPAAPRAKRATPAGSVTPKAAPNPPVSEPRQKVEPKRASAPKENAARPATRSELPDRKATPDPASRKGTRETLTRLLKAPASPIPLVLIACLAAIMLGLLVWSAVRGLRAQPLLAAEEPVAREEELAPVPALGEEAPPDSAPVPEVVVVDPDECEIALWQGYTRSQFYARVVDDGGEELTLGESPAFRLGSASGGDPDPAVVAAHEELLRRLRADGWKVTGANGDWYSLRLRRIRA